MGQQIECDECGCQEFHGPEHEYYAMSYRFNCANCGYPVRLNEPEA